MHIAHKSLAQTQICAQHMSERTHLPPLDVLTKFFLYIEPGSACQGDTATGQK